MTYQLQAVPSGHSNSGSTNRYKQTGRIVDLTDDADEASVPTKPTTKDWRTSYFIAVNKGSSKPSHKTPTKPIAVKKAAPNILHSPQVVDLTSNSYTPQPSKTSAVSPRKNTNLSAQDSPSLDYQIDHTNRLGPDEGRTDAFPQVRSENGVSHVHPQSQALLAPVADMYTKPRPSNTTEATQTTVNVATGHGAAKYSSINTNIPKESVDTEDSYNLEIELQMALDKHNKRRQEKDSKRLAEKRMSSAKEREREFAAMTRQTASKLGKPQGNNNVEDSDALSATKYDKPKQGFNALSNSTRNPSAKAHDLAHRDLAVLGSSEDESRRYHCPICGERFRRRDRVKSHFEVCIRTNGNPEGKAWDSHESCCPKNRSILAAGHGSNLDYRPFHCPLCDSRFLRRDHVQRHFVRCARKNSDLEHKTYANHESWTLKATRSDRSGIDVSAGPMTAANEMRARGQSEAAPLGQSVLQANRKRTIQDMPVGTMYAPSQVASRNEFKEYAEGKRRKIEGKKRKEALREEAEEDVLGVFEHLLAQDQQAESEAPHDLTIAKTSSNDANGPSMIFDDVSNLTQERPPSAGALVDSLITPPQSLHQSQISDDEKNEEPVRSATVKEKAFIPVSIPRPTTGTKGISEATLAAWAAQDQGEDPEYENIEALEAPENIYVYFVLLRNWGAGLSEEKAVTKNLGPFYTAPEANLTAGEEVKYPLRRLEDMADSSLDHTRGKRLKVGWSYKYDQDEHGMQTHKLSAGGFYAEAAVRRGP